MKYINKKEFEKLNIIKWHEMGYTDGTFKPNQPLTRAEYCQAEYNKAMKEGK